MPRKPRFVVPGLPMHVVQRGNNRNPVFFDEQDYRAYLAWLKDGAERYGCAVHAYVLMTNHIHLLVTPEGDQSVSRLMQYVGRRYVPYVNHAYGRRGTLWEGRYKASLVDSDEYLLVCSRYIELNPVRAGMIKSPAAYPWSSYGANGQGATDGLVIPHPRYRRLGRSRAERQAAYRALFRGSVATEHLAAIRDALQTGTPLGNARFRDKIEATLKCRVGHARRGRPRKPPTEQEGGPDTLRA